VDNFVMDSVDRCPNAVNCQVLHKEGFVKDEETKEYYRARFCSVDSKNGYFSCVRFITKQKLGFCPDFIFPNTEMTIDEIFNKLEE
jgi:hypothetical protein